LAIIGDLTESDKIKLQMTVAEVTSDSSAGHIPTFRDVTREQMNVKPHLPRSPTKLDKIPLKECSFRLQCFSTIDVAAKHSIEPQVPYNA
jgi:hypothetical protein